MPAAIQQIDEAIHYTIQSGWHVTAIDWIMKFFSVICNHGEVWIVLAILFLCFKKTRKVGLCMAFVLLIEFILCNAILKNLFARPRPYNVLTEFEPYLPRLSSYSFPSGHSMVSFSAAVCMYIAEGYYLVKDKTVSFFKRHRLGISAIILAVIIAFSRIYLFMHWTTDILGAMLFGVAQSIGCTYLFFFLDKKITASLKSKDAVAK